jgi:hypothetical protein
MLRNERPLPQLLAPRGRGLGQGDRQPDEPERLTVERLADQERMRADGPPGGRSHHALRKMSVEEGEGLNSVLLQLSDLNVQIRKPTS